MNHIDGDKGNYALDNLEWATHQENMRHAFQTGLANNTGEKNGMSKITISMAIVIKSKIKEGMTQQKIADELGVSRSLVSAIKIGRLWSHV